MNTDGGIHGIGEGTLNGFIKTTEAAVRERVGVLGNLVKDFNFKQKPRRPLILNPHPVTDLH